MNQLEAVLNTAANYLWGLRTHKPSRQQIDSTQIVAHRGAHQDGAAKENSLESFQIAVDNKIDAIEFDVQFTADSIPVIYHDDVLGRVFGPQGFCIKENNFNQLKEVAPEIPTLNEVISKFGKKIKLFIEIKKPQNNNLIENDWAALYKELAGLTPAADYFLLTLNPEIFKGRKDYRPEAIMLVDWINMDATIKAAKKIGAQALSGHFLLLNSKRRADCNSSQIQVGSGFIETRGALNKEIALGTKWIFTNHALKIKSSLNQLSSLSTSEPESD